MEAARRKEAREAAGEEGGKRLRKTGQEDGDAHDGEAEDGGQGGAKKPKVLIDYDDNE